MRDERKTKEHLLIELHELRKHISGFEKERIDSEQAKEGLRVHKAQLADRVRELNCLHELARVVEIPDISIERILAKSVRLIPGGFQRPETICARILLEGRQYTTDNYRGTAPGVLRKLVVADDPVGSLDVRRLDDQAMTADFLLSPGEESFLLVVVERLQFVIERMWLAEELRSERARLKALWSLNTLADVDTEKISDHILCAITDMTRSQFGFYGFINPDESVMNIHSWSGNTMKACSMADKPTEYVIADSGVWAEAIRRREPLILNDYSAYHPAKKGLPEGHAPIINLLVVPFFSSGKITAVAAVANRSSGYTHDDATQISTFLKNIDGMVNSKMAEDALRESERRLHRAELVAQAGNWEFTVDTGRFRLSEGARILSGLEENDTSISEVLGRISPEHRSMFEKAWTGLIHEGKPFDVDIRLFRPNDGKIIDVHAIAEYTPSKGMVFGVTQDVTRSKSLERELLRTQANLEMRVAERTAELQRANQVLHEQATLLELAHDAIIIRDFDGVIRYWNRGAVELYNYSREEALGKIIHHLLKTELPTSLEEVNNCLRNSGSWEGELRHITRDSMRVLVESRQVVLQSSDYVDGSVLEINRDITSKKSAEEKLRAIPSMMMSAQEDERKRLASELHDSIGQTLAALKFRVEHILLTLRSGHTDEAAQLAEKIIPSVQHAIDETRTIYMGLRPKVLEDFGAVAALIWYRDELLKLYPEKHIEVITGVEEADIPDDLVVPIFRITQEALNNACKHSEADWIDLSLAHEKHRIELVVADNGMGMDVDQIINNCSSKSLGLTGMRERAEMFGGSFAIESIPGKGTTVRASWPISEPLEKVG